MNKLFTTDEIRRNGYIRYPKVFLDILLKDYCKEKKNPVITGIMLHLYGKAAYSSYQRRWKGKLFTIKKGQCIIKIPELAANLGCSVYAIRKELSILEKKNVIIKKKLPQGLAVEIIGYQDFLFKSDNPEHDKHK